MVYYSLLLIKMIFLKLGVPDIVSTYKKKIYLIGEVSHGKPNGGMLQLISELCKVRIEDGQTPCGIVHLWSSRKLFGAYIGLLLYDKTLVFLAFWGGSWQRYSRSISSLEGIFEILGLVHCHYMEFFPAEKDGVCAKFSEMSLEPE